MHLSKDRVGLLVLLVVLLLMRVNPFVLLELLVVLLSLWSPRLKSMRRCGRRSRRIIRRYPARDAVIPIDPISTNNAVPIRIIRESWRRHPPRALS